MDYTLSRYNHFEIFCFIYGDGSTELQWSKFSWEPYLNWYKFQLTSLSINNGYLLQAITFPGKAFKQFNNVTSRSRFHFKTFIARYMNTKLECVVSSLSIAGKSICRNYLKICNGLFHRFKYKTFRRHVFLRKQVLWKKCSRRLCSVKCVNQSLNTIKRNWKNIWSVATFSGLQLPQNPLDRG